MNTPIRSGNSDLADPPPTIALGAERVDPSTSVRPACGVVSPLRVLVVNTLRTLLVGRKIQSSNAWIAALAALAIGIPVLSLLAVLALAMMLGTLGPEPFSLAGLVLGAAVVLKVSLFAAAFGFVPALAVAAPLYSLLAAKGRATTLTAALVGALPGLLLFPVSDDMSGTYLFYGMPIGVLTHGIALWRERNHARLHPGEPKRHG